MCRIQASLEVRECFYEFARGLARRDIHLRMCAQAPDEICENALSRAHDDEREVHGIVPDAANKMAHLVAQELSEIDILHDKFGTCNNPVKSVAVQCVKTHSASLLVVGEGEESDKHRNRNNDEYKMGHCN